LLFTRLQVALFLSLLAHALHSFHDITLLRKKGVAKVSAPLKIVGQTLYNIRQSSKGLHAGIPRLFGRSIR
jgi:hypothetical protein